MLEPLVAFRVAVVHRTFGIAHSLARRTSSSAGASCRGRPLQRHPRRNSIGARSRTASPSPCHCGLARRVHLRPARGPFPAAADVNEVKRAPSSKHKSRPGSLRASSTASKNGIYSDAQVRVSVRGSAAIERHRDVSAVQHLYSSDAKMSGNTVSLGR